MFPPILAGDKLTPEEFILAVRGSREKPLGVNIVTKTHEEHAVAALRDAIVRGVRQVYRDLVTKTAHRVS